MSKALKPMSAEEVRSLAAPVQELPPFDNGAPFVARLRRISLISLLTAGQLPNDLLAVAFQALDKGIGPDAIEATRPEDLPKLGALMDTMCAAALVEPKWDDVKEYLDDVQKQAIMAYATGGAAALSPFRQGPKESAPDSDDGESVVSEAE